MEIALSPGNRVGGSSPAPPPPPAWFCAPAASPPRCLSVADPYAAGTRRPWAFPTLASAAAGTAPCPRRPAGSGSRQGGSSSWGPAPLSLKQQRRPAYLSAPAAEPAGSSRSDGGAAPPALDSSAAGSGGGTAPVAVGQPGNTDVTAGAHGWSLRVRLMPQRRESEGPLAEDSRWDTAHPRPATSGSPAH